jgi:hypothetical protein
VPLIVERVEDGRLLDVDSVGEETGRDNDWCRIPGLVLMLSVFWKWGRVGDAEFVPVIEGFFFRNPSFEGRFEHMHINIVEK